MAMGDGNFVLTAEDRTAAAFNSVKGRLAGVGSALTSMTGLLSMAAGAIGMGALIKSSLDSADALAKTSDRLGIATEALAGLRYAGELAGVSAENMDKGLGKLSTKLAEAASGSASAQATFQKLGVSYQELSQMAPDQAFAKVADAMNGLENANQRAALSQEIFGKGMGNMVNLMASGSAGLQEAAAEAEALGLSLNRVDAAKLEIAGDSITRMKSVFSGIANTIALQVAPWIQAAADLLVEAATGGGMFGQAFEVIREVASRVFAMLQKGLAVIMVLWDEIKKPVLAVAEVIGKVLFWAFEKLFSFVVWGVSKLADGFRGLNVIFKGVELGIGLMSQFIYQSIAGVDTIISDLLSKIPGMGEVKPSDTLQQWAKSAEDAVARTRAELDALLMKPMPSDSIDATVAGMNRAVAAVENKTKAQAKAMADQGAQMRTFGEIEDTESQKRADDAFAKQQERDARAAAQLQQQLQGRLDAITQANLTETQASWAKQLQEEGDLALAREQSLISLETYEQQRSALRQRYEDQRLAIDLAAKQKELGQFAWMENIKASLQKKTWQGALGATQGFLGAAANLMQSNRRKEFEFGKKAAIASATIGMLEGIGKAWGYGPILGPIFAALVAAQGMMNIRNIKSQQFSGGGAGGSSGAVPSFSADPNTGIPSAGASSSAAPILPSASSSTSAPRQVNVSLQGDGMVSMAWLRDTLIPGLNEAIGDGVQLRTA